MSTNFAIGGAFLMELAKTGIVSDTDLQRIMQGSAGVHTAAELLHDLANSIRAENSASKQGFNLKVESLGLDDKVIQKLRDAKILRVRAVVEEWPGVRSKANLTVEEMSQVAQALDERGLLPHMPTPSPESED